MNDRLKFRVWDKVLKHWVIDDVAILENSGLLKIEFNMMGSYNIIELNHDDYIIEQCVGAKDKKGALLFEGDLIQRFFDDEPEEILTIVYAETYSGLQFTTKDERGDINHYYGGLPPDVNEDWLKIGNIHNKEQ